ncbi:MAG: CheR family methyltransferase [Desulfuromonadaceae bacterium]
MRPATSTSVTGHAGLDSLLAPVVENRFQCDVRRLHILFSIYASTSPEPLPATGLIITPEIRAQCERYLPIATVSAIFKRLYSTALTYPPIFSSTPFHNSSSWADTFASLPQSFQISANPARLLEALLRDGDLMTRFLFASFLPGRFYGGIGRYPRQLLFIREWLKTRGKGRLNCLDAACGTGEETYGLALLLSELGFLAGDIRIEGWTLEPLEVWAANHSCLPDDPKREAVLKNTTSSLFQRGYGRSISFSCRDVTEYGSTKTFTREDDKTNLFDLIICNGLLGGPIIHTKEPLDRAVTHLVSLLAPGGILLAADSFHGGWKRKCPQRKLRALFETGGLKDVEISEGVGGLKPN